MFESFLKLLLSHNFLITFKVLYYLSFFFVPLVLIILVWDLWVQYRQSLFFAKQSYLLLEIKLPRDIFKSPKAMEFCIAGLFQTSGEKNWFEKYWEGKVRAWYSLEIVSIDSAVHFFIWTRKGFKNTIEANLYSQYPGIEISEVSDYTLPFSYNSEISSMWISEFELTKADAFPIKTYVDYGMDKDPKEEFKIDPMTPLIEFLGSMGHGNQVWIQIIVRAHKAEDKDPESYFKLIDTRWEKGAQKEIDKIVAKGKGEKGEDGKIIPGSTRFLTDIETETIKALGRSISKKGFDVGIRAIYSAPKDTYSPANIGGIVGGITHFNSHLNGFKPTRGSEDKYKYFIWLDRSVEKKDKEKQRMLDAYKRRAYFYKPFKRPHFILNTEELATLFHLPGGVSATPTFTRIESRKGEAPANLPV